MGARHIDHRFDYVTTPNGCVRLESGACQFKGIFLWTSLIAQVIRGNFMLEMRMLQEQIFCIMCGY